jgi:hypothetical protein
MSRDAYGTDLAPQHEGIVRLHLKPTIGAKRLAKLTSKEVHGLYRTKLAEGLSTGRVRRIHVTLSRALKDAVRWRDVGRKRGSGGNAAEGVPARDQGTHAAASKAIARRGAWRPLGSGLRAAGDVRPEARASAWP